MGVLDGAIPWAPPNGWSWKPVSDLTDYVSRGRSPSYVESDGRRVLNQKCVRWGRLDIAPAKRTDQAKAERLAPEQSIRADDILWNSTGTGTIGRAAIVRQEDLDEETVVDSHLTIVRSNADVDPRWLLHWISSPFVQKAVTGIGSTNQVELARATVLGLSVPFPPIETQRRIVARIDALFSELDDGEAALAQARADLETYRKSLLKAAVTGALTADWRAANAHSESWRSVPLSTLISEGPSNGWSPPKSVSGGGVFALKLTATTSGRMRLDPDCLKDTGVQIDRDSDLYLRPGDLLFQRGNTREYVGIAAIFDGPPATYIYPDLLIRVRPETPLIGQWLWRYANSPIGRSYMMSAAKGAAGTMPKITGQVVRNMPILFPLIEEMSVILDRLNQALEGYSDSDEIVEDGALDASALRQSILAAAFRGELAH